MMVRGRQWRGAFVTILALGVFSQHAAGQDLGLKVPPGFRVTLYADHELANDIYAMTLDAQGRVVVTSSGYIKTLHDTKGVGKADKATLFATTTTGGMGMCFDGNDLYFCGDGWFSRYRDSTGRGQADGPPERFFPLRFTEHGGHAMRKGPDGWWYLLGGNDSEINRRHVTRPDSPIRDPEAGALLRLPPDCKDCEVIAHGFRNPYDFDFNEAGEIFTYDSDVERDYLLPWYSPTRLYHVGYAGHHGWRLIGYMRSWCRPDYYLDTVDILWPVGRGSPTGVACYRHDQFPEHYRGGLFIQDWTFGKVYFFPLEADGSSYRTKAEVFMESVGTSGFDPTDVVVAPDGSLFMTMGGRKTRGAVYRVEYVGEGKTPVARRPAAASERDAVLFAPQPLDAWSRAKWEPLARKLGSKPFVASVTDEKLDASARVRAVEVLTELFGGLEPEVARAAAKATPPLVRARVAWSLGRKPCQGFFSFLAGLAADADPRVRCQASAALADRLATIEATRLGDVVLTNLEHGDKRVRQASARLASLFPDLAWQALWQTVEKASPQARLTAALAASWRESSNNGGDAVIATAVRVLGEVRDPELRLQAVRLIMSAWGDFHLHKPAVELYTAYSLQRSPATTDARVGRVLRAVRPLFPSGNARLDSECARLLAMLGDDDPASLQKVASFWTEQSSPTPDIHYLVVCSRLPGSRTPELTQKVAQTLLSLHHKLEGKEQRIKQNWSQRFTELTVNLCRHDPALAEALLRHPRFVHAGHVALASSLDEQSRQRAARLFMEEVRKNKDFDWSGPLVELLGLLPREEVSPLLRAQWENFGLRDAILAQLSAQPQAADRDKFLTGLESAQPQVVRACLQALQQLPRDESPNNLLPVLRRLRQLLLEPKEGALRADVLALFSRQTGQAFAVKEKATDAASIKATYQPVFAWLERHHPALAQKLNRGDGDDPAQWEQLFKTVNWSKADAARGEVLFRNRACQTCHTGSTRLGPDLMGVTSRFSREDLFTAIVDPSRDVATAYRSTVVETRKGLLYSGIVVFESADGLIVQTDATTTVRIDNEDIAARYVSNRSAMPSGLLKELKPAEVADLFGYLQTLTPRKVGERTPR